jgi:transposase
LGVDVASSHLDICSYGTSAVKRIANTPAAISAWLTSLPAGSVIAMESTGSYHRALANSAYCAGFAVHLLNPRDVRSYARGLGARGKTDRLDAQVIARYAAHEHGQLRLWQPQSAQQQVLDDLLRRRAVLIKCQQQLRMSAAGCPAVLATLEPLMQELARTLKAFDAQIADAIQTVDASKQDFECITSVPGIGLLSGAALLGVFRRLATASSDAVIAFLGLDPRPMDSGHKVGVRRLSKRGPSEWRRLLFNAAMSAAATKAWKGCYEHERAKGLSRTAALNVLARKMVRVAFSLFKNHKRFDPALAFVRAVNT